MSAHSHPVTGVGVYIGVFLALMVLNAITKLVVISAVLWLVILGALTFSDYFGRTIFYRPQGW